MRRRKKDNWLLLLIGLLLTMSLGYAFIQSDLSITGISKINATSWNVYFDNVQVATGSVALSTGDVAPTINNLTLTEVTYTVTLRQPGDFYEFTVDVKNDGTLNAMIGEISSKLNDVEITSLPAYMSYSVTYSDDIAIAPNHLLTANTTETYKVRIEYRTDIDPSDLPDTPQTNILSFSISYVQADENAIARPVPVYLLPQGKTADDLEVGDEVCINGTTTECFNFIRYDGNDIILLAKYNINVGKYSLGDETFLQNSALYENGNRYGRVFFNAGSDYWTEGTFPNETIKAEYGGSNLNCDVYDPTYSATPVFPPACNNYDTCGWNTSGYSVAYYVEQYKNILTGTGYNASIKSARLLTLKDLFNSDIQCEPYETTYKCDSAFLIRTQFWLGTCISYQMRVVEPFSDDEGETWITVYEDYPDSTYGVRPVIIIEKSVL